MHVSSARQNVVLLLRFATIVPISGKYDVCFVDSD